MSIRIDVSSEVIEWAIRRSGRSFEYIAEKFPKLPEWQSGALRPTVKQVQDFATTTYTPVGFFFLEKPPEEKTDVPDFRTFPDAAIDRLSANFLDTLHLCQRRQAWYRNYAMSHRIPRPEFVGSLTTATNPLQAARRIERVISFTVEERSTFQAWEQALSGLTERIESAGVLVMVSGVVGNNNKRSLDPAEFRGFALADSAAPLIFINGNDAKAAQMFTIVHELAHLWLGQSAITNQTLDFPRQDSAIERWCNAVAAEFLVPSAALVERFRSDLDRSVEVKRLGRMFRVSTLVVLRRLFDTNLIAESEFRALYERENANAGTKPKSDGGDFYNNLGVRSSKRFLRAIVSDVLSGSTQFQDAFRLIGINGVSTIHGVADRMGIR